MIKSILAPSKPWIIKHAIWGFLIGAPAKPSKTRQYSSIFLYWHRHTVPPNFRNLSACARQPARGPCWGDMGLAGSKILRLCCPILRLCWSILGLCWPTLALCWPVLGPRLADLEAYVDPCWAKRSEKWEQQKNTVKRMIFWWSAAYLGAMLAHLGAMLAYLEAMWAHLGAMLAHLGAMLAYLEGNVGPSWGYVGPAWGYLGPSWGYVGPSWGYVDPSWGLSSPMLSHLEPQDPKNKRKKGEQQNTL